MMAVLAPYSPFSLVAYLLNATKTAVAMRDVSKPTIFRELIFLLAPNQILIYFCMVRGLIFARMHKLWWFKSIFSFDSASGSWITLSFRYFFHTHVIVQWCCCRCSNSAWKQQQQYAFILQTERKKNFVIWCECFCCKTRNRRQR